MLYIAIFIVGAIFGYAAGKIDWFADSLHDPSACNQNCRQGRDCDCGQERA